jgi:hypothetical protein
MKNKSHHHCAYTEHGNTPLPLKCDPKVVKPMPRPFVLGCIKLKERKKKRMPIDSFLPILWLSRLIAMEFVH